jgi:hypothetical protein
MSAADFPHPLRIRRANYLTPLAGAVLVARPSRWGNPFLIGRDGGRAQVIAKYEEWIKGQPDLLAQLPQLRGRRLACYCSLDQPCHGDVLARLANGRAREPGRDASEAPRR